MGRVASFPVDLEMGVRMTEEAKQIYAVSDIVTVSGMNIEGGPI